MRINQLKTMLDKETRLSYLVKEQGFNYAGKVQLTNPESIYNFMEERYQLSYQTEEHVYMMSFDTRNNLIGVFHISSGTVNCSLVSPREIFIKALLSNATYIILVHNHPAQSTNPSTEDLQITKRLVECGNTLNLKMLDHLIIGNGYTSLKEVGLI